MKKKVAVKKSIPKKINKPTAVNVKALAKSAVKAKAKAIPKIQDKPTPKVQAKRKPEAKAKITTPIKTKVKAMAMPLPKAIRKESPGPYQEIKEMLERQKRSLLLEAGATLESTLNPTSEGFPDWTDQASVEVDQNCVLRLREREQHLLNKIDDAIERINDDTFGVCEMCNSPISLKRLKARPVTTLCIDCKTKQEFEEKMRQ
jgi:DnaK suppressor protein